MWRVDGLPMHPLVVHLPVVIVPLVAAGLALFVFVPRWRRPLGAMLAAMAVVGALSAVAAVWSGDALGETLRRGAELERHRALGERAMVAAVALAVATLALVAYERRSHRPERRVTRAALLAAVVAGGGVVTVSLTGHSGAQLAWTDEIRAVELVTAGDGGSPPDAPASSTPVPPAAAPVDGQPAVDVVLGEWALVASVQEAPPGPTTFRFRNRGTVAHAFRIRSAGSGHDRLEWRSEVVAPGAESTLTVALPAGVYELDCPVEDAHGEHDALGMEGPFTVRPGAPSLTSAASAPPAGVPTAGNGGGADPAGSPVAVEVSGFAFGPAEVRVPRGAEVTWVNRDPAPHTASGEGWDTGTIPAGGSATVTFDAPGSYAYFCAIHPSMTATVIVAA